MELVGVQANVSVNFIFLIVGLLVSSALPPLAFLLTWSKVPRGAAIAGAIGGQAAAIIAWLVHTKIVYEDVNLTTSQVTHPSYAYSSAWSNLEHLLLYLNTILLSKMGVSAS